MRTYIINAFINAILIAKGTYNVCCSKCGEHFMIYQGKKKDIEAAIKAQPIGVRKHIAKHIKSHNRDNYVPKTIRKEGKKSMVSILDLLLKEILAGIRGFYNYENVQNKPKHTPKELAMNYTFDVNYIPGSNSVGNVSAYYVEKSNIETVKPEEKTKGETVKKGKFTFVNRKYEFKDGYLYFKPIKDPTIGRRIHGMRIGKPGSGAGNIMLNWEYNYDLVARELGDYDYDEDGELYEDAEDMYKPEASRESEYCDWDLLDTLEVEKKANEFLEDIVRGKFIPKGLAGASKLIGWFMSTVKNDPVNKMYKYCKAVKVDEETMKLIKFKMGAKLPRLEETENVPFKDHIYNPDNGGIACEEKTHKSHNYLEHCERAMWWLIRDKTSFINQINLFKNEMSVEELDYWRYMIMDTTDIYNGKEKKVNIFLSGYVKKLMMVAKKFQRNPMYTRCANAYYDAYISSKEAAIKNEIRPSTVYSHCESIFPMLVMLRIKRMNAVALPYYPNYKPTTKKGESSRSTPSTRPSPRRRLTIKVFPSDINANLKEGFLIGGVLENGSITQYVCGRAFDTEALCRRVKSKFGSTHDIVFIRMSPKSVSYKNSWNNFCSYIRHNKAEKLAL